MPRTRTPVGVSSFVGQQGVETGEVGVCVSKLTCPRSYKAVVTGGGERMTVSVETMRTHTLGKVFTPTTSESSAERSYPSPNPPSTGVERVPGDSPVGRGGVGRSE